ncbi:hypothetical protein WCE02_13320 [Pseudomonas juntendi]|uniref:hypothetical protein n=1 Tax=Pseudomonas juntendi TaxID=2666183 RepID=UPI0034D4967D
MSNGTINIKVDGNEYAHAGRFLSDMAKHPLRIDDLAAICLFSIGVERRPPQQLMKAVAA